MRKIIKVKKYSQYDTAFLLYGKRLHMVYLSLQSMCAGKEGIPE